MSKSPITVAQAFVQAINRQNIDELAALMSAEHRFIDALGNQVEGRDKMRAAWAAYFRMIPDYSIAIKETCCHGSVVILLGTARGTYTADGSLRDDNRWQTPVALRAFIENEKVAEWRVYCDNEPIRQKMSKHV